MVKRSFFISIILMLSMNLLAQKCIVFVGSYNDDKANEGIYVFQLDTVTGNLTRLSSVRNILNPSFLTLSPDGKRLFACSETQRPNLGSVSGFKFDPKADTLSFINSQKSGGDNPAYVSLYKDARWIVNANFSGGSVAVHAVGPDGVIRPNAQIIKFADSSIVKERQTQSHIHSAVFSPDYKFIFLPDLGADKIRIYKFNELKDRPLEEAPVPFVRTVPGSGPRHFVFHPNGKFAYIIEEISGTIESYKYNEGKLDQIQRVATHKEELKEGYGSADIHISPDGKFLYASNRGIENTITIFSIQNDGKLAVVGYQSTLGNHPRNFALDASGKFLIVANMRSGDLQVFKRNAKTGLLTKVGNEVKVSSPSCVVIRQYK